LTKETCLNASPQNILIKTEKYTEKRGGKKPDSQKRKETNRTYNKAFPNDSYQNHLIAQGEYNLTK
jgi:hypothetical protein